ncbi:hypothetical protein E2562_030996 [Oryza meyeriana var. granulata]|uniref:Uncharacterized protein n=1 Tax=Oryza meyeriana var. granulata TaxID=110450 RepID=A0A6G1ERD7_9ORYZ|nr:hypothetical protein E2562_030996 [Oryza meyeriana var. granulata]
MTFPSRGALSPSSLARTRLADDLGAAPPFQACWLDLSVTDVGGQRLRAKDVNDGVDAGGQAWWYKYLEVSSQGW